MRKAAAGWIVAALVLCGVSAVCDATAQENDDAGHSTEARSLAGIRLVDRLFGDPNLAPPPLPDRTPVIQYSVIFRRPDQIRTTVMGTQGTHVEARRQYRVSPAFTERPDYWVVVTSADETRRYWIGIEDPRKVIGEHVANETTGELDGGLDVLPEGMSSIRLPFFPEGTIELFPAADPTDFRKGPLDTLTLEVRPPPLPRPARRGSS